MSKLKYSFSCVARWTADILGHPYSFLIAFFIVIIWAALGPVFKYSDTWQLWINTSTTIATFLIVFLIQNTQNRDTKSINLKLDELIKANSKANNAMLNVEVLTDEEHKKIEKKFQKLAKPIKTRKF